MLHLIMLQMLSSPICVAPLCPSKHGLHLAKSLHLMDRNMGLPLEAMVAKWLERRNAVYPVSKEL